MEEYLMTARSVTQAQRMMQALRQTYSLYGFTPLDMEPP
jgi:hypothetical protein